MKPPRYSAVELLVALGLLFASAPLIEDLPRGDVFEAALVTLVMASAVRAVGDQRRILAIALVLVVPALVGKWINRFHPNLVDPAVYLVTSTLFFGFVIARLVGFIVRAPRVDANVLCAGVSGFLMLGLFWIPAYLAISRLNPSAFVVSVPQGKSGTLNGFSAFYFSFVTLCTVGFGDITPASKAARMFAVLEAITGLFYMALLISRLVSLYSSARPMPGANSAGQTPTGQRQPDSKAD